MTGGFSEAKDSQAAKVQEGGGGLSKVHCLRAKLREAITLERVSWGPVARRIIFQGYNCSGIILWDKSHWELFREKCAWVKNPGSNCPGGFHGGQLPGRTIQE